MKHSINLYHVVTKDGYVMRHTQLHDAEQLERLQQIVFPALADDELIKAVHYRKHLEIFPEGQLVVTDGDSVIGMTTTMCSAFDFEHYQHTFKETIAGGWLTNHHPDGDWLYGLDIGVHPQYRGKGLAKDLYRARHHIAQQLQLKGQVTVGMMNGYGAVSDLMTPETYYQELLAGTRTDPTVSAQMKIGFRPLGLITNYLSDPTCGDCGVLLQLPIEKSI